MRLRAVFSKTKSARYISHLDLQRTLERGFRRAGLPLAYTQGYNPGPRFSLASALMLGAVGENEVVDVRFVRPISPEDFVRLANESLPESIRFSKARVLPEGAKNAQAIAAAARYKLEFVGFRGSIVEPAARFMMTKSIPVEKTTKTRTRIVDARELVIALRVENENSVVVLLDISGRTMKPDEIGRLVLKGGDTEEEDPTDVDLVITRVDIMANVEGHYVSLFDV